MLASRVEIVGSRGYSILSPDRQPSVDSLLAITGRFNRFVLALYDPDQPLGALVHLDPNTALDDVTAVGDLVLNELLLLGAKQVNVLSIGYNQAAIQHPDISRQVKDTLSEQIVSLFDQSYTPWRDYQRSEAALFEPSDQPQPFAVHLRPMSVFEVRSRYPDRQLFNHVRVGPSSDFHRAQPFTEPWRGLIVAGPQNLAKPCLLTA